jgi:hypothetical protein
MPLWSGNNMRRRRSRDLYGSGKNIVEYNLIKLIVKK